MSAEPISSPLPCSIRDDAFRPSSRVASIAPYRRDETGPLADWPDLLDLSANEGRLADLDGALKEIRRAPTLRRYPDASELERQLAERFGALPEQVVITAGADDALFRIAMATLEPGRTAITTTPTFEMIPRYIRLAGATERAIPWLDEPFPLDAVLRGVDATTAAIFIVAPNNPTGSVLSGGQLRCLRAGARGGLLIVDQAYAEFADEDLTAAALRLPRTVVTRTFSKAWGLAGLRVGYAIGAPEVIDWLRRAGNPYPVSSVSLAVAAHALATRETAMLAAVGAARREREALRSFLQGRGVAALPSQGNFVLARFDAAARAQAVFERLLAQGVLVRSFPRQPIIADSLRITCPADAPSFDRLLSALAAAIDTPGDR